MKQRILFVDDEKNVLNGLMRMLRSMRAEWEMAFVGSGREALRLLSREPFDVVITDIRMPEMDGLTLLSEVKRCYPHIHRIVLSGDSEPDVLLKSVSVSHQFLAKPCDSELIKKTIERAHAQNELLKSKTLKRVFSRMDSLPSMPSLYADILKVLHSPESSLRKVGEIISKDTGMTAKILQIVNSAYFGLPGKVTNPSQAVSLIGMNTIKSLVLSIHIFSCLDFKTLPKTFFEKLWRHNMTVAVFAKTISACETTEKMMIDDAFTSGMLHDSGKLLLAANFPEKYEKVMSDAKKEAIPISGCEQRVFGVTHAQAGGYLMCLWGLPLPVVESILYHHEPGNCSEKGFGPLTAVHVADVLLNSKQHVPPDGSMRTVDSFYLSQIGMADRMEFWKDACENSKGDETEDEGKSSVR